MIGYQLRRPMKALGFVAAMSLMPTSAAAQIQVEDLVITTGFAVERYSGNLASVTVPVVDSANSANSVIGEVGVRGQFLLYRGTNSRLTGYFDVGLRQFVATGFQLRDYSPRERAGLAEMSWLQGLGKWGNLVLTGTARARSVDDRPPMPLYLQAAFDQVSASVSYVSPLYEGARLDLRVDGERANYDATASLLQLDLLDRRSKGAELGVTWGQRGQFRFFGGIRSTEYPQQASFDVTDPFRRDRTLNLGGTWSYQSDFLAEVGLVGTINRSNSNRPEYDAISVTTSFTTALPLWDLGLNIFGVLTGKSYIQDTDFVRLVPGEEADNASLLFMNFDRALADNLDATLRMSWTRAETDIGDSYYQRYGATLLFNYRPFGR